MSPYGILIVEDEAIIASSVARRLTSLGYEVVGQMPYREEAVEKTEETRPILFCST